jgi:hypothetical protein
MSITRWPRYPVIHEVNTWVWLRELSERHGRPIDLGAVPAEHWDALAALGADAVWLMGVWERSPAGLEVAMRDRRLVAEFGRTLPDWRADDVVGSPYCVRRYEVDAHLGGRAGLAQARQCLAERGLRLVLDFVPNHVAPDHPWATDHPEYFVAGTDDDLRRDPSSFRRTNGRVLACGRDPFFPAWEDVLQLNAFSPALRAAVRDTLVSIAEQADAVRCDMAMLLMNDIFARTWGARVGAPPAQDYWPSIIPAIKATHPDFKLIAEAYWDREWDLQQQGFDYCYDKRLLDRLEHDNAESVRLHLLADMRFQDHLVRFIENHDEARAAAAFAPQKERAAAVTFLTLRGAKLVHEGQLEGRKVHLPVFLSRRPDEARDGELDAFHHRLLTTVRDEVFRDGEWRLCERTGWPDNPSYLNMPAWCWSMDGRRYVVAVNLSGQGAQARVRLPWRDLGGHAWRLADTLTGTEFRRDGDELEGPGLFVDLPPWGFHVLRLEAV